MYLCIESSLSYMGVDMFLERKEKSIIILVSFCYFLFSMLAIIANVFRLMIRIETWKLLFSRFYLKSINWRHIIFHSPSSSVVLYSFQPCLVTQIKKGHSKLNVESILANHCKFSDRQPKRVSCQFVPFSCKNLPKWREMQRLSGGNPLAINVSLQK